MIKIERKKALILLTAVAVAAVMGGIILNAYSASNGDQSSNDFSQWIDRRMMGGMMAGTCNWTGGGPRGHGGYGFIEVSKEYEENVLTVAKNDSDVQALLDNGYNITGVRPIIKTVVEADGSVVTKATSAVVMLKKDTTGYASVWVDLEQGKVTEIVILTRTVIEKS